mmetsp:Transcript_10909/g.16078  ORF Transcript_10909/g.16078 Transcript_10909/m.16078 type:complete len:96 (+) Transcript_10909:608-895(+)
MIDNLSFLPIIFEARQCLHFTYLHPSVMVMECLLYCFKLFQRAGDIQNKTGTPSKHRQLIKGQIFMHQEGCLSSSCSCSLYSNQQFPKLQLDVSI